MFQSQFLDPRKDFNFKNINFKIKMQRYFDFILSIFRLIEIEGFKIKHCILYKVGPQKRHLPMLQIEPVNLHQVFGKRV